MTPEEKARERAKTSMSLCMDSTDEDDIYCEDLTMAYLAGYNEAKAEDKWRDVNEELPEENTIVLFKSIDRYGTTYHTGIYSTDKSHHPSWWYNYTEADIDFMIKDVTQWKPIIE